jgi:hypothetical protein
MPITKIPKAKPIKKPNPVAKASQKVTSGSGRHASKKDFKRQSKHQKAIEDCFLAIQKQTSPQ